MPAEEKEAFEDMVNVGKTHYEREVKVYPSQSESKRFKDPNTPKRPSVFLFIIVPSRFMTLALAYVGCWHLLIPLVRRGKSGRNES